MSSSSAGASSYFASRRGPGSSSICRCPRPRGHPPSRVSPSCLPTTAAVAPLTLRTSAWQRRGGAIGTESPRCRQTPAYRVLNDEAAKSRSTGQSDLNREKGFVIMKMRLVMAAASAALCSHAAFAASEGGDTWSKLQPVAGSAQALTITTTESSNAPQRAFPIAASEGGDTWSEMHSQAHSGSTRLAPVATTGALSVLQSDYPSVYGTPAQPDSVNRVVRLEPGSRWLDVEYGESVKFISTGAGGSERSFSWRFDVSPTRTYVDLRDMAPADFLDHDMRVFIAPDSRYAGG
jgi:hypothetical protein